MNRIALGTAQFGLSYGVANNAGKMQINEARRVLQAARDAGIDTLDTAIAYGDSEAVLGKLPLDGFELISKLPEIPEQVANVNAWVTEQCRGALERLGIDRLRGLLLHRPQQLMGDKGQALYSALLKLREQGAVEKIGISIYCPSELEAFEGHLSFDMIQVPFNPIDRRLLNSGWLERLHERNVEVHVRSIFMQGLLLMDAQSRPAKFQRWASTWVAWQQWLEQTGQTPLEACLRFVLSFPQIARVVVGVDSEAHLRQITNVSRQVCAAPPASLVCNDIELLNPSLWSRL
ncbi:MAG: aldo/keto reductase [Gammaproteobacteria bacterium]